MRALPSRYTQPKPAQVKGQVAQIGHVSAPLKGLNLSSKLTPGDPLTAPVLTNFVIEDDRIQTRAGYRKLSTHADGKTITNLIPFYGPAQRLMAATNKKLADAFTGTNIQTGFTSDDWDWTAFSNLGYADYTILVNGADGVWSWDGGLTSTNPAAVAVTSLSKSAAGGPATCTVAAGDIGKFSNGMTVVIAGAVGTGLINANGPHIISAVGVPANTFSLAGVDTSAASAAQTSGVTAKPAGVGVIKETVTAPTFAPWINPLQFQIVLSHMNRLFFADSSNLAIYYLPLQSKSGEVKYLPLNALFKRGGSIRAIATWTIDGGAGMDDQLVIYSTNGEAVIYSGTDPDTDFSLVGVFRFDPPMSKHAVVNYGGDLYVLVATGLVPMTTLIRAETEQLGQIDRAVISLFLSDSVRFKQNLGWQAFLNPSSGRLICNVPQGGVNRYRQLVRHMPRPVWSEWANIPSRCWAWIDPYVYFGDDVGCVYQMHPQYLNDDGNAIKVDVQMAWSQYKTPAIKHFKMIQTYLITDGDPHPRIDLKVNYDYTAPQNTPDFTFANPGAVWDIATWDVDYWASGPQTVQIWNGVGRLGRVGAPRLTAMVKDCDFAIAGWDVIYESGSVLG